VKKQERLRTQLIKSKLHSHKKVQTDTHTTLEITFIFFLPTQLYTGSCLGQHLFIFLVFIKKIYGEKELKIVT